MTECGSLPAYGTFLQRFLHLSAIALCTLLIFYLSLVTTSRTLQPYEMETVDRAILVLEKKGFDAEVFLLRHATTFRGGDNWLNALTLEENAYASTNRPFPIITLYSDFYNKTQDDTERAMVLLHEAQHIRNKNEKEAYEYVWRHREKLGWTVLSHGTTPTFVTVEMQTREYSPHVFSCPEKLWGDCTENFRVSR